MINLQDTTTIFQLAFGINAVMLAIINKQDEHKNRLINLLVSKMLKYEPSFTATTKEVKNALLETFKYHKYFKITFYIVLIISFSSVICSFCFLISAAVNPTTKIDSLAFIVLSTFLILINPIIYYFYHNFLNKVIQVFEDKTSISETDTSSILLYIKIKKEQAEFDKLILQSYEAHWKYKINKLKNFFVFHPIFHPIRWLKSKLLEKEINKIIKESESDNNGT